MSTRGSDDVVRVLLAVAARRVRARQVLRGAFAGVGVGLGVALIAAVTSRLWWPLPFGVGWLLPIPVALGLVGGLVGGLLRPGLAPRELALLVDRALGTDERLVTALHLADDPRREPILAGLDASSARTLRERLPVRPPRRARWLLALAAAVVIVPFLPQRASSGAAAGPSGPLAAEAQRLQERLAEIAAEHPVPLPEPIEADVEALLDDLDDERLSTDEAIERIDELQRELAAAEDELARTRDELAALEAAADALADDPQTRELGDAMADADLDAAARAARELGDALDEASPEQRRRAGEALKEAAERLRGADDPAMQPLADAMQRAGEQASGQGRQGQGEQGQRGQGEQGQGEQGQGQGEQGQGQQGQGEQGQGEEGQGQEGAGDRMNELADELARNRELAEQAARDREALQRSQKLNGAMEASRQRLGKPTEVASGQSSASGTGDGQGQGEGEGDGRSVAMAGQGHTWEEQAGEATSGPHQDADRTSDRDQGRAIDDFRRLYAPVRLDGAQSLVAEVEGQVDAGGRMDTMPTRLQGAEEQSGRHLIQAPERYREAADRALTTERVPPGYREAVKNYFDSME